jgi:hypothetical protein
MAMSFLTSLLEPLWQEPCSGGIVPMYGVEVPALAAAEGFMRPNVVFAAVTPPPAVRPSFTVGVMVVFSVLPMFAVIALFGRLLVRGRCKTVLLRHEHSVSSLLQRRHVRDRIHLQASP